MQADEEHQSERLDYWGTRCSGWMAKLPLSRVQAQVSTGKLPCSIP